MREEFYDFYSEAYARFEYDRRPLPGPSGLVGGIRDAIEAALRRQPIDVRPDAKYFLLLNFYEMVLSPIFRIRDLDPDWAERLRDDLWLILDQARSVREKKIASGPLAEEGEKKVEISGGDVIEAIGQAWDKIKYNEYLYWT